MKKDKTLSVRLTKKDDMMLCSLSKEYELSKSDTITYLLAVAYTNSSMQISSGLEMIDDIIMEHLSLDNNPHCIEIYNAYSSNRNDFSEVDDSWVFYISRAVNKDIRKLISNRNAYEGGKDEEINDRLEKLELALRVLDMWEEELNIEL